MPSMGIELATLQTLTRHANQLSRNTELHLYINY